MITRAGSALAGTAVVLGLSGWAAGYPELVCLGTTAAGAVAVAVTATARRLRLAADRAVSPRRVSAGDPARAELMVRNSGRRRCPPLVAWERVGERSISVALPALRPGQSHHTSYELPTERRGRYVIAPVTVGRADPLGLSEVRQRHGADTTVHVHPTTHRIEPLPLPARRDTDGTTFSGAPSGGTAFHSLRPHLPGDDWRQIHWRSSARTGTLIGRHNVLVDDPRHVVVLDTSADRYSDDRFEDAVRIAASWCVAAVVAGYPVQLRTTSGRCAPASGRGGVATDATEALDLLADVRRSVADPGLAALTTMGPGGTWTALGVVTGVPSARDRAVVGTVRPRYGTLSIARVGVVGPTGGVPGVLSLGAADSAAFAAAWNRLVRR